MTEAPFTLSREDKATAVWARLRGHLETRLATLRAKNDAPLSEADTARLRGQIIEVKLLLSLNDERPVIEAPNQF